MPPRGLRTADYTRMRAAASKTLPDSGSILDNTPMRDTGGGWVDVWSTLWTGQCMLSQSKEPIIEVKGEREELVVYFLLTVPYDAPLGVNRRFLHAALLYDIRTLVDDLAPRIYKQARIARID